LKRRLILCKSYRLAGKVLFINALYILLPLLIVAPGCGKGGGGGGQSMPTLGVNAWIVAIDDYQGVDDPNLAVMINEFKRLIERTDLRIGEIVIRQLTGPEASRLSFIDLDDDPNGNGLPDNMEELFKMSSQADDHYLNIFFVNAIFPIGTLGLSSSINGPAENGTALSGVLINSFGGFTSMSVTDLQLQGETIAHEAGHYLGLYHTTEKDGLNFDLLPDTPECHVEENDLNSNGSVETNECENLDGPNLMFWQAAPYTQETLSPMQSDEMIDHPLVDNGG
jgi:hypothetical protein